ncbi:MAG: hypothetical protein JO250_06860 [Armatimonadetes bacterium]|nr:hypothetical protein [Armatimonadota bacterium]
MRYVKPFFLSVLLGLALCPWLCALAPDYAHAPQMVSLLHWARMPVRVCVVMDSAATPERERSALAGFGEWVQATAGAIRYQLVSDPARADIVVTFDLEPTVPGHPGAVGHTDLRHEGPVLARADMTLATAGVSPDELTQTAAHEFGHALGINGHSDGPDDLMSPDTMRLIRPDGTPLPAPHRAVTARDLNTLWLCYPSLRPGASPPQPAVVPASHIVIKHKQSKSTKHHKNQ